MKYSESGNGRPLLERSAGEMSVNSLFQSAGAIFDCTCCASMPGYQLKRFTMPSAWISGLAAKSTNFLAICALAAFDGIT